MVRLLIVGLLVVTLPACAVSTPSSMFSSLNNQDNDAPPRVAGYASSSPTPREEKSSVGSTISGWWDSVKSGFGGDEGGGKSIAPQSGQAFDPIAAQKLVNAYRAQKGLKPLKLNVKLSEAARRHSEDLAKSDRISHYGSDGSDAWERVRKTGYGAKMTAENVGTGQQSVDEVFRGWQKSKDHNANLLLKDADEMGVAMVYNPKSQFKTFWTMVVAAPKAN
jgi:uncharacterized protein YkwD